MFYYNKTYIFILVKKKMVDLEVKVLGSSGRGRRGISVKLDFTGEWFGAGDKPWGFSEEICTDNEGSAYFEFDEDYDGAPFDLYVDHKREREYNLGKDSYIETNLYGSSDDEDD